MGKNQKPRGVTSSAQTKARALANNLENGAAATRTVDDEPSTAGMFLDDPSVTMMDQAFQVKARLLCQVVVHLQLPSRANVHTQQTMAAQRNVAEARRRPEATARHVRSPHKGNDNQSKHQAHLCKVLRIKLECYL